MNRRLIIPIAISALIISLSQANPYQTGVGQPIMQAVPGEFQMSPSVGNTPAVYPNSLQTNNFGQNSISGSGLGPQMGFNPTTGGNSISNPQYALDNPYIGGEQPAVSLDPNLSMDAPGIVNPLSIQSLVDNANSKVGPKELEALQIAVQAYVDGNLGDARKHFSAVAANFPEGVATDRAYLGLAKIERAYGAYDVSRRILEAVIRKNRDYESIMLARRSYKDLQAEVNRSVSASQRDMDGAYAIYKQIGWLNIFSKIKAYNNYKDAKANFEGILISSKQFDPIFAQVNISTPIPEANIPDSSTQEGTDVEVPESIQKQIDESLTIQELAAQSTPYIPPVKQANFLNPTTQLIKAVNPVPASNDLGLQTSNPTQVKNPTEIDTSPTVSPSLDVKPISEMSLDEARSTYLAVYEQLKEALKGDDAKLKQKLQADYRSALQRYNELRNQ